MTFDPAMPVGNLPSFKQVFTEDFSTPLALGAWKDSTYYKSKFRAYGNANLLTGWQDSSKHGTYVWHNMEVKDGYHTSHIGYNPATGKREGSALIPIRPDTLKSGFQYGRFSVRARFTKLDAATGGYWKLAWLLWPDAGNNELNGEIDFPELNLWTAQIKGFVHYTDHDTNPIPQGWYNFSPFDFTTWHVYTMEWTPQKIVFLTDGVVAKTFTGDRVPHVPMHWVMQNETALGGNPTPSTTAHANIDTDWVAAWVYDPSIVIAPTTTVSVTSPVANATVSSVVQLEATAPEIATSVKWFVDGVQVGYDGGDAPWTAFWDSKLVANGVHRMFAKASTPAGWLTSPGVNVTVSN